MFEQEVIVHEQGNSTESPALPPPPCLPPMHGDINSIPPLELSSSVPVTHVLSIVSRGSYEI